MNSFRLIIDPPMKAAENMAKDHALLHGLSMPGSLPTLRLFRWEKPSVTIGYFQKIDECVHTDYCSDNGISVVRRETGGGSVLHDMELTYSFTVPVESMIVSESVDDSFRDIIEPVINTLKKFYIDAEYRPVNDIIVKNKKISGSAQVRQKGILQQHGTILLDLNSDIIKNVLIPDMEKINGRGFNSIEETVTSISEETGFDIDDTFITDFINTMLIEFSRTLNLELERGNLNEAENLIMKSYIKKFVSDEWNLKK